MAYVTIPIEPWRASPTFRHGWSGFAQSLCDPVNFSPGLTAWALLKYQVNKWLITINIDRQIDGWMDGQVFRFNGRPGAGTELRRPRRHLNFQANDYWVTWQHNGEGETVPIFSGAVAV